MPFDFKAFQASLTTSYDYEVVDPVTKTPLGWVIELATAAHPGAHLRFRAVLDAMAKRKGPVSMAQDEKDGVDMLCARIVGWRGLVEDGREVPYTPEAAQERVGMQSAFWLREQLVEALKDTERPFVPKNPGNT